jgi:hypothetical protein
MSLPTYNADEILNALQGGDYKFVLEKAMPQAIAVSKAVSVGPPVSMHGKDFV